MRINLIITIVLFASSASAQTVQLRAKYIDNEMVVKFFFPDIYQSDDLDIYRKASGESWQKINTTPIQFDGNQIDVSTKNDFYKLTKDAYPNQLEGFSKLLVLFSFLSDNEFAEFIGSCYRDVTVQENGTYAYKITKAGSDVTLGQIDNVVASTDASEAPKVFSITPQHLAAQLNWDINKEEVFGANIYKRKKGSTEWTAINKTPILALDTEADSTGGYSLQDIDVEPNETYEYHIKALDFFGQETNQSQVLEFVAKDMILPNRVTDIEYIKDDKTRQIQLAWSGSSSDDISHYKIARVNELTKDSVIVSENILKAQLQFTDKDVTCGTYHYYVIAVDEAQNENPQRSYPVELLDVIPPAAPGGLTLSADIGKVTLTWEANQEADLLGYNVYRTINDKNSEKLILLTKKPIASTTFTDELSKKTKNNLVYKVLAVDTSYNYSNYSTPSLAKLPDVTPPEAPHLSSAVATDSILMISWLTSPSVDTKEYQLFRKLEGDSSTNELMKAFNGSEENYVVPSDHDGKTYQYSLVAIDSTGNVSDHSNIRTVKNPGHEMGDFLISSFKAKLKKTEKKVNLKWETSGEDLIGVVVYRYEDNQKSGTPITQLNNSEEFTDKDLSVGIYNYQLRAYNANGDHINSNTIKVEIKK